MNLQKPGIGKTCFVICLFLVVYLVLRACSISFTHDESLSYKLLTDKDYFAYTANNHLMNTWLMAFCAKVFGESELSLRLPSLALFVVYLFFCCKLLISSPEKLYVYFAIPLLFLNPFVLDFFALARGYGISLGFMMGALYYFLRASLKESGINSVRKEFGIKNFALSMLFASFALFSNLSLINFYIALFILFSAEYFLNLKKTTERSHLSKFILVFILACLPLLFNLKRLMVLKEANDLYVGASSFDETISTFIERSSYFVAYPVWFTELLQSFIIYIFPIGLIITLLRRNYQGPLFKLGLLMTCILVGFYAEHFLFSTLFPISRTGIYFIPLFAFFIFYLFIQFIESLNPSLQKGFLILGLVLVSLPLCIHFFRTMNLSYTFEWKYDKHTKEVVMGLENKTKTQVLGHNWIFGPTINYYIQSRKLNIKSVKLEGTSYDQDFIYEFKDQVKDPNWIPVKVYEDIGAGIYKQN